MISSKFWLVIILLTVSTYNVAQVGIGTTNPKAVLDINSASSGILMPRLTTKERLAIENPAQALTVYDLDLGCFTFWHSNQWHCLCGENDVLSPKEDIDDDDDGIRDTDEIANCIANGEDVIFSINEATVPDNPSRTGNNNIDESTGVSYTTITGNYFTSCGVGTWSFTKNINSNDESVFNNNMDEENNIDITTPPVGTVNSNKKLYFHFKRRNNDDIYLIDGTFTFSGPPIKPIFCANSEVVQNSSNSNLVGPKFKYAFENIWFEWSGGNNAIISDEDNEINYANGTNISSGSIIEVLSTDNSGNNRPRMRSLSWELELPEVSSFNIYTNKTGRSEEGIALRAVSTSSTNYSFNDNDGIASSLDIDSDNDGIYDVVEAGFKAYDTNSDGILNSSDNGYLDTNNNGMHDTLEDLTPIDTNNNGVLDAYELDADSDTCLDVYEAGFTDTDKDGVLDGTGIDNSNGKVTGNTDGYTDPGTLFQNNTYCGEKDCPDDFDEELNSGLSGNYIYTPSNGKFYTVRDNNNNAICDVVNKLSLKIKENAKVDFQINSRLENGKKIPLHINTIELDINTDLPNAGIQFRPTHWSVEHSACEIKLNGTSKLLGEDLYSNDGRLRVSYQNTPINTPENLGKNYTCNELQVECN